MYIGGLARMKMLRAFLRAFGLDKVYVITANPATRLVGMMMHVLVGEPFENIFYEAGPEQKKARIESIMRAYDEARVQRASSFTSDEMVLSWPMGERK